MGDFYGATGRFYENLNLRADALVNAVEAGQVEDFEAATHQSYAEEVRALSDYVNRRSSRSLWWAIPAMLAVLALGITMGVLSQHILPALLIISLGAFVLYKLLPDQREIINATQNGQQHFQERIQAALFAADARTAKRHETLIAPARESLHAWQSLHKPPTPQPYGVSPAGAESWIRDWMIHMGAENAQVTRYVGDGGIDVESDRFIAQVKHYTGTVGVGEIREHVGVAAVDSARRTPLFFTSGTYAAGGLETANQYGMALFVYSVEQATVTAVNSHSRTLLEVGLNPSWWRPA